MAIKDSIFIKTNSQLKEIKFFEENGNFWFLQFDNNISFSLYSIWRLFINETVSLISNDHKHKFGLPNPVDLVADLNDNLKNKILIEIQIEKNTGDLILIFSENTKLIAYTSSMGYESYEVFVGGKQFVAQGGGDITTF